MSYTKLSYFRDKPEIKYREYGRHVQNMVDLIVQQPEKEKRNQMYNALVEVIRKTNPALAHEGEEGQRKLWDHLHWLSNFKLDVDGKYPIPDPEIFAVKPQKPKYSDYSIKNRQFGRNFQLLLKQACALTDPEEKEGAAIKLGKLIKHFYSSGTQKDHLDDAAIVKQVLDLSNGALVLDVNKVIEHHLFDLSRDAGKPVMLPHERREANASKKKKKYYRKRP